MAKRVQVLLVCDVHDDDTTEGTETISFALDGSAYEIDVCEQHAAQLRESFAGYVGHARRAGSAGGARRGPRSGRSTGRSTSDRQRMADIRAWARERGMKVNDRGRLAASIVEEYEAAH